MVAGTGTAEVHRQEGAGLVGRPGERLGDWLRMSQMEEGAVYGRSRAGA